MADKNPFSDPNFGSEKSQQDQAKANPFNDPNFGKDPSLAERAAYGFKRMVGATRTALTDSPEKVGEILAEQTATAPQQSVAARRMQEEIKPYQDAYQASSGLDAVKKFGALGFKRAVQLVTEPVESAKLMAEQVPNSLPGLAGGYAGMKAGAALGTAVAPGLGTAAGAMIGGVLGGTAGAYLTEKGSSIQEQVQKKAAEAGVNQTDAAGLANVYQANQGGIDKAAALKGVGTSGTDAVLNVLTMGLSGAGRRMLSKEIEATYSAVKAGGMSAADGAKQLALLEARHAAQNTLGQKALRGAGVIGGEMGGEALSEAAGQKLAYGSVDPLEVIDEGLLGFGQGAAMGATSGAFNKIAGTPKASGIDEQLKALRGEVADTSRPAGDAPQNDAPAGFKPRSGPAPSITGTDPASLMRSPIGGMGGAGDGFMDAIRERKPSEVMGLSPDAGPMSAAAALAVDTGASVSVTGQDGASLLQRASEGNKPLQEAMLANDAERTRQAEAAIPIDDASEADRRAYEDAFARPAPTEFLALSPDERKSILYGNKEVNDGGQQFSGTQNGDILNGMGTPFKTRFAAARRARMMGHEWGIAPVAEGFVARWKGPSNEATQGVQGVDRSGGAATSTQPAPTRDQAIAKASDAAGKVLASGGTDADANRAATDSLIDQMAATPSIDIAQDAPAAVKAAKAKPPANNNAQTTTSAPSAPATGLPAAGSDPVQAAGVKGKQEFQIGGKDPHTRTYDHRSDGRLVRTITYPDGQSATETLVTNKKGDELWVSNDRYGKGEFYPVQLSLDEAETATREDMADKPLSSKPQPQGALSNVSKPAELGTQASQAPSAQGAAPAGAEVAAQAAPGTVQPASKDWKQTVYDKINQHVFRDSVSVTIKNDGQKVLTAIGRGDIATLQAIANKYGAEAGRNQGGGGAGPGKVKQARRGAEDVFYGATMAIENIASDDRSVLGNAGKAQNFQPQEKPNGTQATQAVQAAPQRPQEPAAAAEPVAERTATEHAGLKIYPTKVKIGDTVVDMWGVQTPDNARREKNGERQIGGDPLSETLEGAKKNAEAAMRDAKDRSDREAESKAADDAAQAKKDANKGKSILQRRADALLDKQHTYPPQAGLGQGTRREAMQKAVDQGRAIVKRMVPDTAAKHRDQTAIDLVKARGFILGLSNENIPVVKQGLEAKARMKANQYEKPEYRVYDSAKTDGGFYEITKTEFDYAKSLEAKAPEVGDFGPILTQYRGDAQGAIKALTELQDGEAVAALNHPEVGDIDLVWGVEGTRESNGHGLAKLVKWHPEILADLQGVISSLKIVQRTENRIQLESEAHKAAVRLEWDGKAKHWLLTAFEKKDAGGGTRTDTTAIGVEDDTARLKSSGQSVAQTAESSKATHQDPGAAPEAATAPVIAESLQKAAKKEERPLAEMKAELLGMIDAAVKETPNYKDYLYAVEKFGKDAAEQMYARNDRPMGMDTVEGKGRITFDVPGDGKFTVVNSYAGLMAFRAKIAKASGNGFSETKRPSLPASTSVKKGSTNQISAIESMLEDGDLQAAKDYMAAVGISTEGLKKSALARMEQLEALGDSAQEVLYTRIDPEWQYSVDRGSRRATLTRTIGKDVYRAYVIGGTRNDVPDDFSKATYGISKNGKKDNPDSAGNFHDALVAVQSSLDKLAEKEGTEIQATPASKAKDTGWSMAGTGYAGKRYSGRNMTLDDGREVVARIYENAGVYEEAEVKVDGKRVFAVTDRNDAQGKADDFIKTLTSAPEELNLMGFTKTPTGNGTFTLSDSNMRVTVEPTGAGFQARMGSGTSGPRLTEQQAIEWAASMRDESIRIQKDEAKAKPADTNATKEPWQMTEAEFGEVERQKALANVNYDLERAKNGSLKPFVSGDKSKAALVRRLTAEVSQIESARPEGYAGDHLAQINKALREGKPVPEVNLKRYDIASPTAEQKTPANTWNAGAVVSPDEFPLDEATRSYDGISQHSATRARSDRDQFVKAIQDEYDAAAKVAETPEQKAVLESEAQSLKADYLSRYKQMMGVRSGAYSGFFVGRANLNVKQADKRNDALTRANETFDNWLTANTGRIKSAVLNARNADQLAAVQEAKDAKAADKERRDLALMGKILAFKSGDDLRFGTAIVTRVSLDKDGYPNTITVKSSDGTPLTNDKINLASEIFGGRGIRGIQGGKQEIRRLADIVRLGAGNAASAEEGQNGAQAKTLVESEQDLWARISDGAASVDEFKAGFENWVKNKAAILSELTAQKKDDLLARISPYLRSRYKSETKQAIAEALWSDNIGSYALGASVTYGLAKDSYQNAVRRLVEATDDAKLAQYAAEVKAEQEQRIADRAKAVQGMENPTTLEDFRRVLAARKSEGMTFKEARMSLTPEQRATFDDLTADESRKGRKQDKAATQAVRVAGQKVDATIIETQHTQKGHDLFVVQLAERVERADYDTLNANAKKMGGYYSSFRGRGAVPGFQFTDRATAEAFVKLANGDRTDAQASIDARRDAFADDGSQSASERLTEMADRLEQQADDSLSADRKVNTARRARFASAAEASARASKAMAKTMRNIAQALANGKAKYLDRIRTKTQVEALQGHIATARYEQLKSQYTSYDDQEKHRGEPPNMETADFAEFPQFTAYRSDLASLARQLIANDGTKLMGQRLLKVADDVSDAFTKFAKENSHKLMRFSTKDGGLAAFGSQAQAQAAIDRSGFRGKAIPFMVKRGQWTIITSPSEAIAQGLWTGDGDKRITLTGEFGADLVEKIGQSNRGKVSVPWQFESAHDKRKMLSRMGIETPAEFRAALREFIALREQAAEEDRVKALERAMVGRKNDGLDFFPTPQSATASMIDAAGIEPGMRVLEPSAGIGHIAERIREAGVEPDVGELSNERRELLEAKGFNLVASDFMELTVLEQPDGQGYDRILMNPPFSNGRDIDHVQHAYTLLKPGGRMVAIMGESAFTNQNKKASAFREWLEQVGGTDEKLDEGTFLDPSLPVNTGANARMVVIDRPSADSDTVSFSRAAERNDTTGFYSALAREIESLPTKAAPAMGWQMAIQGMVKNGKVKADELEWSGLTDWLKLQTGKVTKEQITGYLDANGVQVEEVMLGGIPAKPWAYQDGITGEFEWFATKDEAEAFLQGQIDYAAENAEAIDENPPEDDEVGVVLNYRDVDAEKQNSPTKYSEYTLSGGENYREVLLTLPIKRELPQGYKVIANPSQSKIAKKFIVVDETGERYGSGDTEQEALNRYFDHHTPNAYKSSHWDQPNVLAHIRVNDRVDADGASVLFVEELQSDWQQEKRKGDDVPDAPFIKSTDAWLNLAIKRVITMAVEGGYDKIAFVNGEQSADRYDLSKQVDRIGYSINSDGTYNLDVEKTGASEPVFAEDSIGLDRIEAVIGKDFAKKIEAGEGREYRVAGISVREFTGLDLKVGGEGMKTFYDQIVPNAVKALLKKLGGGQMENMTIVQQPAYENDPEGFPAKTSLQPGLTITDTMREKVAGGLPLFTRQNGSSPASFGAQSGNAQQADPQALAAVDSLNDALRRYFGSNDYGVVLQPGRDGSVSRAVEEAIRAAFGKRVVPVAAAPGNRDVFNGFQIPGRPDDVFVNVNARVGFVNIAGHELWHSIERQRPDLIAWYREQSRGFYKNLPAYRDRLNALLQAGERPYTDKTALSELEADFLGDSLTDRDFLQSLADASPSKFKALLTHIGKWLDQLIRKLKGLGSTNEVTDVQALRGYLKEVLVAFAERKDIPQAPSAGLPGFARGAKYAHEENQRFTRQWYDRLVSLLPASYRNDPHRREPIASDDRDVLRAAQVRIDALNKELRGPHDRKGHGPVTLDKLGNLQVDVRVSPYWDITGKIKDLADQLDLGVVVTGANRHITQKFHEAGFESEISLAAIADRLTGVRERISDEKSVYASPAFGTILSYKPRGFPMALFSRAAANDQTNTPAFKAWFGDSKVVGANGKPLVVYHGTRADFSVFYVPHPEGKQRFYFAADPSVATEYSNDATGRPGPGANLLPVFVSLKNPAVVEAGGANFTGVDLSGVPTALHSLLPPEVVRRGYASLSSIATAAEKQGHDGVVVRNVRDGAGPYGEQNPGDVYIAFRPEQIKSATGNNGNFDPANPDIRFSRRFSSLKGSRPTASYVDATPRQQATLDAIDEGPESTRYDLLPAKESLAVAADAQFTDWELDKGIKYIPVDMLGTLSGYDNAKDAARIERLAKSIKESNSIEPIFVGIDPNGEAFIMEGQHRARAFKLLGEQHIPAQVVVSMEGTADDYSAPKETAPVLPTDYRSAQDQIPLFSRATTANDLKQKATEFVNDFMSAPGKLNWWHKTVGTQYNLAQRSPEFRRVFDAVQGFINDVSFFATEAADQAPTILPKLETWKDIGKSPVSAQDTRAIAAPIFEGTLVWTRDATGKPVKHDGDVSQAGIVWSAQELRDQFGLNDAQIKLYREFRSAVDKSLTNLTISDMLYVAGKDAAPIRDAILESKTVSRAADDIAEYLQSLANFDPDREAAIQDTINRIRARADRANDLMARGYAPLSRFGKYTLDVVDSTGERVYFGLFESQLEASRMARKMEGLYPQATMTRGTLSDESYKLFAGVAPETVELFGDMLGLEDNEAYQSYLKLAKSSRSAMKRLIHRGGVSGFSEDAGRVLAGFVYSNARQTSQNLHTGEMNEAAEAIPKRLGELKDAAVRLVDYIKNPQDEAQQIRGLLFAQYIGGSVASAMVNMTQPLTMTLPWLSQFGGITAAGKHLASAAKIIAKKSGTGDKALDEALRRAEEDGTVSPQEVHDLMRQAQGRGALQAGDGTKVGDAMAAANNILSRVVFAWGKLFSAAEQFNRRLTFIAAYQAAVDQGMADPEAFARRAIAETQGVYNKGNKPQWARGAIGSTLFTFKQYSISYVEMLHRMATKGGPEGRRAALYGLGILVLLSGVAGAPGSDDLDDLISGIMQALGYNFDSKAARRRFLAEYLGTGGADFVERGVSGLPGVPIDVSGRLGLGNLIPGTGLLTRKQDHTRDVAEIAGPAGDLFARAFDAAGKAVKGDVLGHNGAVAALAPRAVANLIQAADMADTGMYRDRTGKKVVDTDTGDALAKALGFQPNAVKRVQDNTVEVQRMADLNRIREAEIADKWALGLFEKNQDKVQEAMGDMARWNEDNPDTPIRISFKQIAKRLHSMNMTKAERVAKTAPSELRQQVRAALETQ